MKNLTIILLSLTISSCVRTNLYKKVNYGNYNLKAIPSSHNITINKDSTFEYELVVASSRSVCKGQWEIISKNMILINGRDIATPEGFYKLKNL